MERWLLKFIIAHFHYSQHTITSQAVTIAGYSCAVSGVILVLIQSLAQFGRARAQARAVILYAAAIAGFTFLAAFWIVDIQMSNAQAWRELRTNVADALQLLPGSEPEPGRLQAITVGELEETGRLSSAAKAWLKGASITTQSVGVRMSNSHSKDKQALMKSWRIASIHFPNGQQELVGPYDAAVVFYSPTAPP